MNHTSKTPYINDEKTTEHIAFKITQNKFNNIHKNLQDLKRFFDEYKKYFDTFLKNQDFSIQKCNEFIDKRNDYTREIERFVHSYNREYDNLKNSIENYKKQPYRNDFHIQEINNMTIKYNKNFKYCTSEAAEFNRNAEINRFVQKVKHFHYQNTFQNSLSKNMIELLISMQKSIAQYKQQIEGMCENYQQKKDNYKLLQKQNIDNQDLINAFNAKQRAKGGENTIQIKNKYKNQQNDSSIATNEQQMSCQGTYKNKNHKLQNLKQELFDKLNNVAMYNNEQQISQPSLNQQHIIINESRFKDVQSQYIQSYSEVNRNDLQNNNSLKADENNQSGENKNISPNDEKLFQNIQSQYTNQYDKIFSSGDESSLKSYYTVGFQEKLEKEILDSQAIFYPQ